MPVIVDLVKSLIQFVASFLKNQWGKMIFTLACALFFLLLIFPYGDLTSFASRFIFEKTGIPTLSEDLGLTFLPLPGAKIEGLKVNISTPPLSVSEASIYPSIVSSLLHGDAFFSADLEDIFGGNMEFSRSPGDKIPEKEYSKEILELEAEQLELSKVLQFLKTNTKANIPIPIKLTGKFSLKANANFDPLFMEEPNIEFFLTGTDVIFPPQSVPTAFGPLQFPEISWKEMLIRGRLVSGELVLEEIHLGKLGDPMILKTKGKLAINLKRPNERLPVSPRLGAYEFDTDLMMSPSVDSQVGILLSPIAGNYKSQTSSGSRYLFRAQGINFRGLPETRAIRGL